jgi:hypothetical protein
MLLIQIKLAKGKEITAWRLQWGLTWLISSRKINKMAHRNNSHVSVIIPPG